MGSAAAEPSTGWRPTADLAWTADEHGRAAIVDLNRPASPPVILEGTGAAIWEVLSAGPPESVVDGCVRLGMDAEVVERFLEELGVAGLARRGA